MCNAPCAAVAHQRVQCAAAARAPHGMINASAAVQPLCVRGPGTPALLPCVAAAPAALSQASLRVGQAPRRYGLESGPNPNDVMLTIRNVQMQALALGAAMDTEERALRHLRGCIPPVFATTSDVSLRDIIRWGRRRSQGYGIEAEVDFFRYLNLMFMFGFEFDVDPQYPWAATTLQSRKPSRPNMDLLMDHALLHCSRVAAVAHTA